MEISDIISISGLPKELDIDAALAKEEQRIKVRVEKRRYGKLTTIIDGLDPKSIDVKGLTKYLKSKIACGGTYKGNRIELQGDHRKRIKQLLVEYGFKEDQIEVD